MLRIVNTLKRGRTTLPTATFQPFFSKKVAMKKDSSESEEQDFEPIRRSQFPDLITEDIEQQEIAKIIGKKIEVVSQVSPQKVEEVIHFSSVDFYDNEFQSTLREFCHYYQIPYLESNVPKTALNAAKIYFRMCHDQQPIVERFQKSKLVHFLKSLSAEDIDDSFNPFKLKEKWMKFFRTGLQRVQLDNDRVLKNEVSETMIEFISDQVHLFNDMQLIRAMVVLSMTTENKHVKVKDKVFNLLLNNTLSGKFELKRGNLLAAFAQAVNLNFVMWMGSTENFALESYRSERMHSHLSEVFTNTTMNNIPLYWYRICKTANVFIPFLQHYFQQYKPSQKLVILRMLQQAGIYNAKLYSSFVKDISKILSVKDKEEDLIIRLNAICVSKHPVTNEDINRFFEIIEVLDFHYQHQNGDNALDKFQKSRLLHLILDELRNDPNLLLGFSNLDRNFRGMYPNLIRTSDNSSNEADFYKQVLRAMAEHLVTSNKSHALYGALTRVERICSREINIDQQVIIRVLSLFQEKLVARFDTFKDLIVKESFILALNLKSIGVPGYDESQQLTAFVNDFKASFALLNSLKLKFDFEIGDEQAWREIQAELCFILTLQQKFNRKIEAMPKSNNFNSNGQILRKNFSIEEQEDLANRMTPFYRDMSLISFGSNSRDYIPDNDILRRMRNECLVDYHALELNKRRLLVVQPDYLKGKKGESLQQEGLLKHSNIGDKMVKDHQTPKQPKKKSMIESVFDKDGEYRKKFKEFEEIFDNSLTSMDSQSDQIRMDNETFFKIFHDSQCIKAIDDWNLAELFKTHEALQGLEMPLYADGNSVVGHKLPQFDFSSVKSAAALHSFALNLKQITRQTLFLQQRGELTQPDLQNLLDCFELIEPEHRLIILAQDLDFYRDLQTLNNSLTTLKSPIPIKIFSVPRIDPNLIKQDLSTNDIRSGVLQSLSTLYFKKYLTNDIKLTPEYAEEYNKDKDYLNQLIALYDETQSELINNTQDHIQKSLQSDSLERQLGKYFHYLDGLMNNVVYQVDSCKILEKIKQVSTDQVYTTFLANGGGEFLPIIKRDYSASSDWLKDEFSQTPRFHQEQLNLVLINQPILKQFIRDLRQKQASVSNTLAGFLKDQKYASAIERRSIKNVAVFPFVAEYVLHEPISGMTTLIGNQEIGMKAKQLDVAHSEFENSIQLIKGLQTGKHAKADLSQNI